MGAFRSGFVALVGRPNVGKSTLLNAMLGQKVSIVTSRPQTTRHRVLGICESEAGQIAFLDTPGMHQGQKRALNRAMNRAAGAALGGHLFGLGLRAGLWCRTGDRRAHVLCRHQAPLPAAGMCIGLGRMRAALWALSTMKPACTRQHGNMQC